jgi:BirA family biotin operon repressor/biotin-[acetyl-CoA-carboxylase] ligase
VTTPSHPPPAGSAEERRERVLEALAAARGDGVSGQALAAALGCSRAAVHRHVEALRREGLEILGEHEGYRLGPEADPVVAALVAARLRPPLTGPLTWSRRTGSTNDDLSALARAGAPEGSVVGADVQDAGRGRRGRPWLAAPGEALLVSVLLRPRVAPAEAGTLPLVAAVAVAEALGPDAGISWPNDILVAGRKVCGILCELSADEAGVAWIVVGIGVNVRGAPEVADGRWRAGSLRRAAVDPSPSREDVLVAILNRLGERYAQWRADGPGPALAAFSERDLLAGHGVAVEVGGRQTTGTASGLDAEGRLRIVTAGGEVAVAAGEVVRVETG